MRSTLISYVLEYIYLERNSLFLSASVNNNNNDKEKVEKYIQQIPERIKIMNCRRSHFLAHLIS